jgi:hypothetical protein
MGNKPVEDNGQGKKPYGKPVLRQINLRPEEAVLGGCKTAATAGLMQAHCNVPTTCPNLGTS